LHRFRVLASEDREAHIHDVGGALLSLVAVLDPVDALAASKEAIDIFWERTSVHPLAFRPQYAMVLHNYAILLQSAGQLAPALDACERAAAVYRELAREYPERYRSDYADELQFKASLLDRLGKGREARAVRRQIGDV